ncbi:MAG TPA: hypothetical protein VFB12_16265 [Ktedonobacteraceae bacterium]|nr:hypothetical protein [Ktedonobacteraceae bacterium]
MDRMDLLTAILLLLLGRETQNKEERFGTNGGKSIVTYTQISMAISPLYMGQMTLAGGIH